MAPPPIAILFEDEHLLIVVKPASVLVVDAPGRRGPTLLDLVDRQLGARVMPVHRLDEDTTGVMLLARTAEARAALDAMLRERTVERVYLAAVARLPSPAAGRIESRLQEGPDGVMRSVVNVRAGKLAVTNYRTIERRDYGALVECRLETGRRNQIRAHLSELGCPILGDRKYGWRVRSTGQRGPARPLLHAVRIEFEHPFTRRRVSVRAAAEEPELQPLVAGFD